MSESRKSGGGVQPQSGGSSSGKSGSRSGGGTQKDTSRQSGAGGEGMAELTKQGQEAVSQAQEAVSEAQDQAVKLVSKAREQATTQVTTQKERAAVLLGALGTALQDTSRQVREQDEAAIADSIDMAAKQLDHLATMLQEQDIGQLIDSAQQFARRQPMLFAAAAIAAGFVGARFLKSSGASSSGNGEPRSDSSWSSSGQSNRSGMSSEFGDASSRMESSGYGSSMGSSPGARRQ